jgi:hypothetical protein
MANLSDRQLVGWIRKVRHMAEGRAQGCRPRQRRNGKQKQSGKDPRRLTVCSPQLLALPHSSWRQRANTIANLNCFAGTSRSCSTQLPSSILDCNCNQSYLAYLVALATFHRHIHSLYCISNHTFLSSLFCIVTPNHGYRGGMYSTMTLFTPHAVSLLMLSTTRSSR